MLTNDDNKPCSVEGGSTVVAVGDDSPYDMDEVVFPKKLPPGSVICMSAAMNGTSGDLVIPASILNSLRINSAQMLVYILRVDMYSLSQIEKYKAMLTEFGKKNNVAAILIVNQVHVQRDEIKPWDISLEKYSSGKVPQDEPDLYFFSNDSVKEKKGIHKPSDPTAVSGFASDRSPWSKVQWILDVIESVHNLEAVCSDRTGPKIKHKSDIVRDNISTFSFLGCAHLMSEGEVALILSMFPNLNKCINVDVPCTNDPVVGIDFSGYKGASNALKARGYGEFCDFPKIDNAKIVTITVDFGLLECRQGYPFLKYNDDVVERGRTWFAYMNLHGSKYIYTEPSFELYVFLCSKIAFNKYGGEEATIEFAGNETVCGNTEQLKNKCEKSFGKHGWIVNGDSKNEVVLTPNAESKYSPVKLKLLGAISHDDFLGDQRKSRLPLGTTGMFSFGEGLMNSRLVFSQGQTCTRRLRYEFNQLMAEELGEKSDVAAWYKALVEIEKNKKSVDINEQHVENLVEILDRITEPQLDSAAKKIKDIAVYCLDKYSHTMVGVFREFAGEESSLRMEHDRYKARQDPLAPASIPAPLPECTREMFANGLRNSVLGIKKQKKPGTTDTMPPPLAAPENLRLCHSSSSVEDITVGNNTPAFTKTRRHSSSVSLLAMMGAKERNFNDDHAPSSRRASSAPPHYKSRQPFT